MFVVMGTLVWLSMMLVTIGACQSYCCLSDLLLLKHDRGTLVCMMSGVIYESVCCCIWGHCLAIYLVES